MAMVKTTGYLDFKKFTSQLSISMTHVGFTRY